MIPWAWWWLLPKRVWGSSTAANSAQKCRPNHDGAGILPSAHNWVPTTESTPTSTYFWNSVSLICYHNGCSCNSLTIVCNQPTISVEKLESHPWSFERYTDTKCEQHRTLILLNTAMYGHDSCATSIRIMIISPLSAPPSATSFEVRVPSTDTNPHFAFKERHIPTVYAGRCQTTQYGAGSVQKWYIQNMHTYKGIFTHTWHTQLCTVAET
jgi:hypothetical protein